MNTYEFLHRFWQDIAAQNALALPGYFTPGAVVRWHATNECFTVPEFVRANCEYPGSWQGQIERVESMGDLTVTVTRVVETEHALSFHAVSFFHLENGLISSLDEYWCDDGPAPQWRLDKKLGRPI